LGQKRIAGGAWDFDPGGQIGHKYIEHIVLNLRREGGFSSFLVKGA
jgi:hypothetical protein